MALSGVDPSNKKPWYKDEDPRLKHGTRASKASAEVQNKDRQVRPKSPGRPAST